MISFYTKVYDNQPKKNMSLDAYFDNIKNGEWQDIILDYRTGKIKKNDIPIITASGVFKKRAAKEIVEHSGFICIDIDAKDQIATIDIEQMKLDPFVSAIHKSVSGNGYAAYIKIDPVKHLEAFLGLESYLFINYSIVIDKSCKDTSRARYVSYDPDIFINEKSKVFKKYLKKKEIQQCQVKTVVVKSDFDQLVNDASNLNLFDDYADYISLCFALADEFKDGGRNYLHSLCSSSTKYSSSKTDKDFDKVLNRTESGITIAFVYYKFKLAGLNLMSEKTQKIKQVSRLADNPKEVLKSLNIIDEENLTEKFKQDKKEETELDLIIELIKLSNIRFNEITRCYEINGDELNDRLLSNFYTKVWTKIDDGISKDKVFTLIQNDEVTKSYNPIINWFEDHKDLTTNNEFEKLVSCFEINHTIFQDDEKYTVDDYLDVYLKKWLLGLIGSAFGTYSLMILVMNGEQGTNKTEFFRNLLPKKLRSFYSESNLDEGKDSEILMTKKWLIVDDEFGGKSKKDATKLKRLSSQQTFSIRMPYGRITEDLKRLSVLGGTSNDSEVINDPTGNRRIIPVNLLSFDLKKYLTIDKDLLFVELYNEWVKDKTAWFLTKTEIDLLNKTTIENTEVMAEEQLINKYFVNYEHGKMTSTDVMKSLAEIMPSLKTNTKRIGQALKKCGFDQNVIKQNGKTVRSYRIAKECVTV